MNLQNNSILNISAADLRDHPPESGFLRSEVRRHIKLIEHEIRDAHRSKDDSIRHEIETNFAVSKITNRSAQRFIYSSIIDQLTLHGFQVKLVLTEQSSYFCISWATTTNQAEINRQDRLIADARV